MERDWTSTWKRSIVGMLGAETLFITLITCNRGNMTWWRYSWAHMESWLIVVDCVGKHARRWSYIRGSTRNHETEGKTNDHGWMRYSVYAVLSVSLYSVYAVLGVNSSSWHGEIETDELTLCATMMIELWTRKKEIGMMMRTIWRIRADMRNPGYDLPEWVGKTSYQSYYMLDRISYLLFWVWSIDWHTKFS